jgi:ubiquinone/menaquinone biosynthesis C-methylase UbiE
MTTETTLNHAAARALYDRVGRWQDTQRFYEDTATADLLAHADLGRARAIVELGSGTGRLAERLLRDHLPPTARYLGLDISTTMVKLARQRLAPWAARARVEQSGGSAHVDLADGSADRFLSTFVLDLLSATDIALVVHEARRLLAPDGLLCLVSATHGRTPLERMVMGLATRLHAASPALVGGCRAIDLRAFVEPNDWQLVHWNVVSKWGVPSEVLVASPRSRT